MTYIAPTVYETKFTCPQCNAIAQQSWNHWMWNGRSHSQSNSNPIRVAECTQCGKQSLWLYDRMLHPSSGTAPTPNSEMPEKVKTLYLEAASIQSKSPRGAAALLRLSIQILCGELGESGRNIDKDIAALVKKGLPEVVQQSLDAVRVIGNHAVHPGQIDTDNEETVGHLFSLVNVIVEYMIAMPKKVSGIYSNLPKKALEAIDKRDANKSVVTTPEAAPPTS